jgi:pimeloyl-ACP methyl ester carboxylesterase
MLRPLLLALCACTSPRPFTGMVPTDDGALFARSDGSGPDIVCLHGLGDSSVTWRKLEAPLRAAGYRVTLIDALGAGSSDKPERGPYDLDAQVRRLGRALDHLGIRRTTLLGNSLGGSVALRFAMLHPHRVRALALISPAAYPDGGWTAGWLYRVPDLGTLLSWLPPRAIAELALQMNFGDPSKITTEDLDVYTEEAARPGVLAAFVALQRQVMPTAEEVAAWTAAYPTLDLPVLVLWGTRDKILAPALGDRLCRELPRARLLSLPGVGHAAQLEAPDDVLREVVAFLRGERNAQR